MQQQDGFQVRLRTEAPGKKAWALGICAVSLLALSLGTFAADARADGKKKDEIPFDDARIIIETNATDCDSGIQVTLDGEPWKRVSIENPKGRTLLDVKLKGSLRRFGLTEQFNESNEPVMDELVGASDDCDEEDVEFTLEKFFRLFPEGPYEFEGKTIEGDELEGEAWLSAG